MKKNHRSLWLSIVVFALMIGITAVIPTTKTLAAYTKKATKTINVKQFQTIALPITASKNADVKVTVKLVSGDKGVAVLPILFEQCDLSNKKTIFVVSDKSYYSTTPFGKGKFDEMTLKNTASFDASALKGTKSVLFLMNQGFGNAKVKITITTDKKTIKLGKALVQYDPFYPDEYPPVLCADDYWTE